MRIGIGLSLTRLSGGAGAWSPADLESPLLWYYAGPAYAFRPGDATPCASGETIAFLHDRLGSALTAKQTDDALRPTLLHDTDGVWKITCTGSQKMDLDAAETVSGDFVCWAIIEGTMQFSNVIGDVTTGSAMLGERGTNSDVYVSTNGSSFILLDSYPQEGRHYVILTRSGSTVTLYLNGVQADSDTLAGSFSVRRFFNDNFASGDGFGGKLWEVGIAQAVPADLTDLTAYLLGRTRPVVTAPVAVHGLSPLGNYQAFGGVVGLANGNYFACWCDLDSHTDRDGDVWQKTSTDGGATWGAAASIDSGTDTPLPSDSMAQLTGGAASGRIIGTFCVNDPAGVADPVFTGYSDDSGVTWTTANLETFAGYDWMANYGRPVELTPGGNVVVPLYGKKSGVAAWKMLAARSTNQGVSWALLSETTVTGRYLSEATFLPVSDGLLAVSRDDTTGTPDRFHVFRSADAGATWDYQGELSNGLSCISPTLVRLGDGRVALFGCGRAVGLVGMWAQTSSDEGVTWTARKYFYTPNEALTGNTNLGYPSVVATAAGVYGHCFVNPAGQSSKSDVISFALPLGWFP